MSLIITMHEEFKIPPKGKADLTPPELLVERLRVLIATPFKLTRKSRTDGSNIRKLVAQTLQSHPLPPSSFPGSYTIVPPKQKGVPSIIREYIDTYIVTTGDSYNLQVWNRNPSGKAVQVEYSSGEPLSATDVRFVMIRVDPDAQEIRSVIVMSPEYIVEKFGRFGKPTKKYQLIISSRAREEILKEDPPLLFYPDTSTLAGLVTHTFTPPRKSMHDAPDAGEVLSLEVLRDRLVGKMIGTTIGAAETKKRGQALESLVAQHLGYKPRENELLAGGYPDIRNQALEVKVQDSPTVDLGKFTPQFEERVEEGLGITTGDIRYLLALTEERSGIVRGIVLCPGSRLGDHFSYVADESYKCQRSIPMEFFRKYDGHAVYNP